MAEKKTVRVCMVGAGQMANKVHYPSLASFDDVQIVGIGDLIPEAVNSTADKHNIPQECRFELHYPNDYQKMIEKQSPDCVYVVGQPHIMFDIWVWCLQQGLNLFIEKPMGMTMHQAQLLAHLADKHGCITQVGHQRRSCPLLVKMREACLAHGPITHAVCEFFKYSLEPFINARDHMLDDCTHSIDTLRWMCGGEVVEVDSRCKRVGTPDYNWIGVTMQFDNDSTGYVVNSWSSGRRVFRVQMHAPGVYTDAEVESKAYLYEEGDYDGKEFDTKEVAGSDEIYVFGGFQAKNREFIDSVKSGHEKTSSPFSDCVKTMEVVETVLAQALLFA